MVKKFAILISAHKPIPYIEMFAKDNSDLNFYVYLDLKVNMDLFSKVIDNLIYIDHLVEVKLEEGTKFQSTLKLLKAAVRDSKADFFHFISGEHVMLYNNQSSTHYMSWNNDQIYMDMVQSKDHQYRVRFVTPHVEKKWLRKIFGKAFIFCLRMPDKIFPTNNKIWFGCSWLSIRRKKLEKPIANISSEDIEHFFEYVVQKSGLSSKKNNNGNNPIYLNVDNLMNISKEIFLG